MQRKIVLSRADAYRNDCATVHHGPLLTHCQAATGSTHSENTSHIEVFK